MALSYEPHIMRLSDDILLHIMSFLSQGDVLSLAQVCTRLEKISKDRTLWKKVDLRSRCLTQSELEDAIHCLHKGTKVLASAGCAKTGSAQGCEMESLSPSLFELVTKRTDLETLILEEHFINAAVLTYKCFPPTLKHLSIENCKLINLPVKESYFFNMSAQTPMLESLNLNGCVWFEDHSMMAISKCPQLKTLQLRQCTKVGTCSAYIFLSARFGFERIEVLDVRETSVTNAEVRAFKSKTTLKRLYLDGTIHRQQDSSELDRVTDHGLNTPEEQSINLEVLVLTNTEVTDVTLRYVPRNMPNLKLLDVRGTKVTEPGIIRLKTELPSLQVVCDFPEWTNDPSKLPPNWLIDIDFKRQEDIKRPPRQVPGPSDAIPRGFAQDRIEIITVEPGIVRLRRIINRPPQVQPPAQVPVEEAAEVAQQRLRNQEVPQPIVQEPQDVRPAMLNDVQPPDQARGAELEAPRSASRDGPSSPKRSNNSS